MPSFGAWEWIVILMIVLVMFCAIGLALWIGLGGLRRWIVGIGREIRDHDDDDRGQGHS
jgi:Sec-independent protein translocase protein TatA